MGHQKQILICLGAGASQLPVINTAKKLGWGVLGIDLNADAPGVSLLDEFINLSTYVSRQVVSALKGFESQYQFIGIVARTSGPALKTAAGIAEAFDLPGLRKDIVPVATEKSALQKFCQTYGFPIARGVKIKSVSRWKGQIDYPLIVKPDFPLVGKKHVRVVQQASNLRQAIEEASRASNNGYAQLQEYIDGIDVSCLFWSHRGKAEIICFWDELVGVGTDGRIIGLGVSVPSVILGSKTKRLLMEIVHQFSECVSSLNCLLILSFRIDMTGEPYVVELHADLGGDLIADELFPKTAAHFDFFRMAVGIAANRMKFPARRYPDFSPTLMISADAQMHEPSDVRISGRTRFYVKPNIKDNIHLALKDLPQNRFTSLPKHHQWFAGLSQNV